MKSSPEEVQTSAKEGLLTQRVHVGPRDSVVEELRAKTDVVRAMHEQFQLCLDPQTESTLHRESLGVSRVNHIHRVHGHTVLEEGQCENHRVL